MKNIRDVTKRIRHSFFEISWNNNKMNATMKTLQDIVGTKFTWYDYSFFLATLLVSAFIGVYYGFYKKQQTAKDYLFGGKVMGPMPVALSFIADNISGVALMAIPSDVYTFGISYWFTYISIVIVLYTAYRLFVPVFYKLQVTSTFEYLQFRFGTKVRLLGSVFYLMYCMLFLPIVIYVPSLALSQATGINVYLISVFVSIVGIFYTSMGGFKAVVYSDAFQFVLIVSSLVTAFILGIVKCGGIGNVWNTSYKSDRLTLAFNIDFTKRNTFWAVTFGTFVTWSYIMGVNQVYVQKYLALPSSKDVTKVLVMSTAGIFAIGSLCNFMGLVMFTAYSDCDPLTAGILQKPDQLIPYFVMDLSKLLPGLAGLYIAGVFSAALSSFAGNLNGLCCTIYQDFISRCVPKRTSQQKISTILKLIAFTIGIISTAMVVIIDSLGGILALTNSVIGIIAGPILGLYVSGMLMPVINSNGAFYGGLGSVLIVASIVFGSQWYQSKGIATDVPLPVSVDGCPHLNSTYLFPKSGHAILSVDSQQIPYIFRITFYWYSAIGLTLYLVISTTISLLTKNNESVDKDLLSPAIYRFLPDEYKRPFNGKDTEYTSIGAALTEDIVEDSKM